MNNHRHISLFILILLIAFGSCAAQEKDSVRIKIMKDIDGEMQVFEKSYPDRETMINDPEFKAFQEQTGDTATFILRTGEKGFNWTQDGSDRKFIVIDEVGEGDGHVMIQKDHVIRLKDGGGSNFMFRSGEDEDSNVIVIDGDSTKTIELKTMDGNATWVSKGGGDHFYAFRAGGRSISIRDAETEEITFLDDAVTRELKPESMEFNINASEGTLSMEFTTGSGDLNVNVYNSDGGQIFTEYHSKFDGNYAKTINLSGQEAGTYFLEIRQGQRAVYKKILIR